MRDVKFIDLETKQETPIKTDIVYQFDISKDGEFVRFKNFSYLYQLGFPDFNTMIDKTILNMGMELNQINEK